MTSCFALLCSASGLLALIGSTANKGFEPFILKEDSTTTNVIYVNSTDGVGDDNQTGLSASLAVKTMGKAFELVSNNGTIVVCGPVNSSTKQEIYPAKNVKITSKVSDTEDYLSVEKCAWNIKTDIFFQGSVYLDDINLKKATMGDAGFCANGHDFHVGENVNVTVLSTDGQYLNINGGTAPLKNQTMTTNDGANLVVESGSYWDIIGSGSGSYANCLDEINVDEDVVVTIKGSAKVHALYGAFSDRTVAESGQDGTISTIGNVTINVEDSAYIKQLVVGSDAQNSARMHQKDGCAFTVNLGENTSVGAFVGGGLYCYETPTANLIGPESIFNQIVVNYYGATLGDDITIGGVEIPVMVPPSTITNCGFIETIKDFRLNLYKSLDVSVTPGYIMDAGYGVPTQSSETVNKLTVAVYNNSTFTYNDLSDPIYATDYGVHPFELKNRAICYMDSGDRTTPMSIPDGYNPTIIEFGTEGDDKESVENNVFSTESDMTISSFATDDSNFTFVLEGDEMPVVTVEDKISSDGGKINLSFKDGEGNNYVPEEDVVIFQVPAALTEEEKEALASLFMVEGMDTGKYYLAYQEGTDGEGNPIGQIVIKEIVIINVDYTVEHYKEQLDGTYVLDSTERYSAALGQEVTATAKSYDHYHVDSENANAVGSLVIESGTPESPYVLKVYYKLDTFKVVYNANVYGTLEGGQVKAVKEYRYGEALDKAPAVTSQEGYEFDYWVDANGDKVTEFPATVEGNQMYTAVWKTVPVTAPIDTTTPNEEKDTVSRKVNVLLHVIIGAVLGFGITMLVRIIKKKVKKSN